ncbi:hypothetical protein ACVIGB_000011 [Bradyrhizobium sp. USDA 4341]
MTPSVPQFRIETPLSTVTIPGALITVAVKAPGKPAVSCTLHAEKLVETLQVIEGNLKIVRADRYARVAHTKMQQSIATTVREQELKDFTPAAAGVACAALWCLLNDPKDRDEWRKKLSAFLQSQKMAFVGFDLREDGRYVYAMDAKPLLLEDMDRAVTDAAQMNAASAERASTKLT